jgi:hypothetical protein
MLNGEEIENWNADYGEVDYCFSCGMTVPVMFMCEDTTYCEYFNDKGEDE